MVHGAIAGWNGQVAVVMPGSRIMESLYGDGTVTDDGNTAGEPVYFTPAVISGIQVAETVKMLTSRGPAC